MAGVGLVTVSLRKSMVFSAMALPSSCEETTQSFAHSSTSSSTHSFAVIDKVYDKVHDEVYEKVNHTVSDWELLGTVGLTVHFSLPHPYMFRTYDYASFRGRTPAEQAGLAG